MEDVRDKVKEIKQSFRLMMDGSVAQSMRDKGLNYHLNWGATLPRLKAKAEELKAMFHVSCSMFNVYDLAIALWKENVRECKILATMLMPPEQMLPEVCDIWMEQVPSQEIAEQAAFNLWQYLPYAPEKAYQWIASDQEYYQLCGFHVLSRLFMNGQEPNEPTGSLYVCAQSGHAKHTALCRIGPCVRANGKKCYEIHQFRYFLNNSCLILKKK